MYIMHSVRAGNHVVLVGSKEKVAARRAAEAEAVLLAATLPIGAEVCRDRSQRRKTVNGSRQDASAVWKLLPATGGASGKEEN